MPIINITPELIEKNHWRYHTMIRPNTGERINKIMEYGKFTCEDLAVLLEVDIRTARRYMKDYTRMPVRKIWLLSRLLNVTMDCFPDMGWWQDHIIKDIELPQTDADL